MDLNLKGKNAVVFGVANDKSIAWAIAKALNDAGCRVALAYQDRVEAMVKPLLSKLNNPIAMASDVADDKLLDAFFSKVKNDMGKIHIVLHSVAFAKKENFTKPFVETDRANYHLAEDVSAYSLVALAQRAAPLMADGGSIIALTYLGGIRVVPGYNVMGICKAALEANIRYIAYDLGPKKIRVNGISAGPIATMAASAIPGFSEMLYHYSQKSPLKRNITAEEVANTALFLCSDLSSGITGQVIYVDSGYNVIGM